MTHYMPLPRFRETASDHGLPVFMAMRAYSFLVNAFASASSMVSRLLDTIVRAVRAGRAGYACDRIGSRRVSRASET